MSRPVAWITAFRRNLDHIRTVSNGYHRCELCWMWQVTYHDDGSIIPAPDDGYKPATQPYPHHPGCLAGEIELF